MTLVAPTPKPAEDAEFKTISTVHGGPDWVLYEATQSLTGQQGLLRLWSADIRPARQHHVLSRARWFAELELPGWSKVLSAGTLSDGRVYVFMEGRADAVLNTQIGLHRLTDSRLFSIAEQLTKAVEHAYLHGMLYLGLRPDTILLDIQPDSAQSQSEAPTATKILFCDCVRHTRPATSRQGTLSEEALAPITPWMQSYVAEEVSRSADTDDRAIVYSLGIVLHQLLYDALPGEHDVSHETPPTVTVPPERLQLLQYLQDVISGMVVRGYAQRPRLSDAAHHIIWAAELNQLLSGKLLAGRYQPNRLIAFGGMGAVLEAADTKLGNRRVAVKLSYPQYSGERIRQEIDAAIRAGETHRDIISIFDHGVVPDCGSYIVMEYLAGESVATRLKQRGGRLPEPDVMRYGRWLASALQAAHSVGVVHRDLKPDNIMIVPDSALPGRERLKILDFGIARVRVPGRAGQRLTRVGMRMGTPNYMAPEQVADASSATDRADVYSLGAMLFELLGGTLPVPSPLTQVAAPALVLLLTRMTALEPALRPSMAEVERQLEHLQDSAASAMTRLRWLLLILGVALAVSTLTTLGWLSWRLSNQQDTTWPSLMDLAVTMPAKIAKDLGTATRLAPPDGGSTPKSAPNHSPSDAGGQPGLRLDGGALAPSGEGNQASSDSPCDRVAVTSSCIMNANLPDDKKSDIIRTLRSYKVQSICRGELWSIRFDTGKENLKQAYIPVPNHILPMLKVGLLSSIPHSRRQNYLLEIKCQ